MGRIGPVRPGPDINIMQADGHVEGKGSYVRLLSKRLSWLCAAGLGLTMLMVADILIGPAFLAVGDVLRVLVLPEAAADPTIYVIVHELRLPMTLMAMIVGASLGIAGTEMQTILGNPLACPYTLGFSAAAGFGAALIILSGFELPLIPHDLDHPSSRLLACRRDAPPCIDEPPFFPDQDRDVAGRPPALPHAPSV